MRATGKQRAIRNALYRLGLHTTPKGVVQALAQAGVQVDEELVRQVRLKNLKENTGGSLAKVPRPIPSRILAGRRAYFALILSCVKN